MLRVVDDERHAMIILRLVHSVDAWADWRLSQFVLRGRAIPLFRAKWVAYRVLASSDSLNGEERWFMDKSIVLVLLFFYPLRLGDTVPVPGNTARMSRRCDW